MWESHTYNSSRLNMIKHPGTTLPHYSAKLNSHTTAMYIASNEIFLYI